MDKKKVLGALLSVGLGVFSVTAVSADENSTSKEDDIAKYKEIAKSAETLSQVELKNDSEIGEGQAQIVPEEERVQNTEVITGGKQIIKDEGRVSFGGVTGEESYQIVRDKGSVNSGRVNEGAKQILFDNSRASGVKIAGKGTEQILYNDAVTNSTTKIEGSLIEGAKQTLFDNSKASNFNISGEGTLQILYDDSDANVVALSGGATQIAKDRSTPGNMTITDKGTTQKLYDHVVSKAGTVSNGAEQQLFDDAYVINYKFGGKDSKQTLNGSSSVKDIEFSNHAEQEINGASEDKTATSLRGVFTDATQTINAYGIALDSTIDEGSTQIIGGSGLALMNTVENGGAQNIKAKDGASRPGLAALNYLNNSTQEVAGVANRTFAIAGATQTVESGGEAHSSFIVGEDTKQELYGKSKNTFLASGISNEGYAEFKQILNDVGISSKRQFLKKLDETSTKGGTQNVYAKAEADETLVKDGGSQVVHRGGTALNTIVLDSGSTQIISGEKALSDEAFIMQGGAQIIKNSGLAINSHIAPAATQYVEKGGISIESTIHIGGVQYLGGNDLSATIGGEQYVQAGGKTIDTVLVDSGKQMIEAGGSALDVTAKNESSIVVNDAGALSGADFNDFSHLNLSADAIVNGDIHFKDEAYAVVATNNTKSSAKQNAKFNLQDKETALYINTANSTVNAPHFVQLSKLEGSGSVLHHEDNKAGEYYILEVENLSGNLAFGLNTNVSEKVGDKLVITESSSGAHTLMVSDSGTEPTKNSLTVVDDQKSAEASFSLANADGTAQEFVDKGTYQFVLAQKEGATGGKEWYLTPATQDSDDGNDGNGNNVAPAPDKLRTTPAADAIIHLASAPQLIFNSQLDNLRFRRGEVRDNIDNVGGWARLFTDKTKVYPLDGKYTLEQTGLEIGFDKAFNEFADGTLLVGLFGNYSDNRLKHDRGGKSSYDSLGLGLYGTYFFDNGFYVDGVLKFNHYKAKLDARSTGNAVISGDYKQNGYGFAVEIGRYFDFGTDYFAEPYGRVSYASFGSREFTTNHGMHAEIKEQDTLMGEVGVSVGKTFDYKNSRVKPYLKAALAYEFGNDSEVVINRVNHFKNDFGGTTRKYGVGVDVQFSQNGHFFTELNYRKGRDVESSYRLNLGFQYNF